MRRRDEGRIQHRQNRHVQDEQRTWEVSPCITDSVDYADGRAKAPVGALRNYGVVGMLFLPGLLSFPNT
jgi:hypothetical protein